MVFLILSFFVIITSHNVANGVPINLTDGIPVLFPEEYVIEKSENSTFLRNETNEQEISWKEFSKLMCLDGTELINNTRWFDLRNAPQNIDCINRGQFGISGRLRCPICYVLDSSVNKCRKQLSNVCWLKSAVPVPQNRSIETSTPMRKTELATGMPSNETKFEQQNVTALEMNINDSYTFLCFTYKKLDNNDTVAVWVDLEGAPEILDACRFRLPPNVGLKSSFLFRPGYFESRTSCPICYTVDSSVNKCRKQLSNVCWLRSVVPKSYELQQQERYQNHSTTNHKTSTPTDSS